MTFLKRMVVVLLQLILILFKRWYNLCINGEYLIDDENTERLIEFLKKVSKDPNYQPTEDEQEFEKALVEDYKQIIAMTPGLTEENYPYQIERQQCAIEELNYMKEYAKIKER